MDVLTPKQALFFWPVAELLERRGFEILVTARRYEQLNWVLELLPLKAVVLGRFGGESLVGKLSSSTERQRLFLRQLKRATPSAALSSGSIEMARVCFGLQIPHLLASDTPHSPVNKLCVPISAKILTPFAVGVGEWMRWSAPRSIILRYKALDPVAWIKRFSRLEVKAAKPPWKEYALVRVPEYKASYILGRGLAETVEVVEQVAKIFSRVVVLCRYRGEANVLKNRVPSGVTFIASPVLALPYIRGAAVVLSGGGTIAQESSLLGKPTVFFYPGETPAVHRFLQSRGLLWVLRPGHYEKIGRLCEYLTSSRVRRRIELRAERLMSQMEDPATFIERVVSALLS